MIKLYLCVIFLIFVLNPCESMTRAQMKQSGKVMKNVCQPKHKVTNEQIDNIQNGEFINNKDVKCYISCVFTMAQMVKNGKLSPESIIKQIDLIFPEDLKDRTKKAVEICKYIADKYKNDICEASFEAAKCLFKTDPEVFIFP